MMTGRSYHDDQHAPRVIAATATDHNADLLSLGLVCLLALLLILLACANHVQAQPRSLDAADTNTLLTGSTSAWTDSNCNNCHDNQALFSHPVNVLASMSVPADLPLENGQITCVTCHDNSSSQMHMQARANHTPMLRAMDGESLCLQCHDAGQSMHGAKLGKAHLASMNASNGFGSTSSSSSSNVLTASDPTVMDSVSRNCLSCHDGSVAKDVSSGVPMQGNGRISLTSNVVGSRSDHPMGVYPVSGIRSTATGEMDHLYVPSALDSRIQLVEGKVSCISCHSPYSQKKKQLVMSNFKSALCLSCHVDQ
jgi:predicted CXXCH cytochrome family protein